MAQIDLKKAIVKIGTLELHMGSGNLTWTEKRNIDYLLERGLLDDVREGDQVPMDVKLEGKWEYYENDMEALMSMRNGTGTSSDTNACRPKAYDISVTWAEGTCGTNLTPVTLPDFRWEEFSPDLRAGTISVSGKCNATMAVWGTGSGSGT